MMSGEVDLCFSAELDAFNSEILLDLMLILG